MEGLKKVFPFWTSRIASDRTWEEVCLSRNPAAPRRGHLLDVRVIAVRGENEHLGVGKGFANLPGGLQTVEQRHRDVHHHHGGTEFPGQLHGLAAGGRFADHLDVAFGLQHLPKALADDRVVFGQQDGDAFHRHSRFGSSDRDQRVLPPAPLPNGICAWMVVPLPGADSTLKLPPTISTRSLMPSSPRRLLLLACNTRSTLKDFAVVFDFHANGAAQFLDAHFHPAGLRMAGDIGQRFLGDAIEHRALGAVQLLHPRKGRQADADARLAS